MFEFIYWVMAVFTVLSKETDWLLFFLVMMLWSRLCLLTDLIEGRKK